MGKKCPGCGNAFVGFGKVCDVCKRRGIQFASESPAVSVEPYEVTKVPVVKELQVGDPCPTCGQKVKPKPLTHAERQKRWREKQR